MIRISLVEEDYWDELEELQLLCLPDCTPINVHEGDWWIAHSGKIPVAFGALKPSMRWRLCGYLARAGVAPDFRGRGLQQRLIRVRERQARRLGWQWLVTDTTDNPPSSNNLINCGFRLYAPEYKWASSYASYWRKYIAVAGKELKSEMPR